MLDNGEFPRSLALHDPRLQLPAGRLRSLLSVVEEGELPDTYGDGGAVASLETRVAGLLGKDAAVLMPTGAMASQVALRLHADARATRVIGFHPLAPGCGRRNRSTVGVTLRSPSFSTRSMSRCTRGWAV